MQTSPTEMLRPYQRRALDELYKWFDDGHKGNPCLVLPTGSGKSHIVAAFCREALQEWPETRILMLTHSQELIQQNAEKMLQHWSDAPLGIYSAGIGRKELGEPITFAGIQSIRTKAAEIGFVDIILIDECHLVNHKAQGGYRKLIDELAQVNPAMRVIGLTATPYRLGHGLITDKPAIFDALIEPAGIPELIFHKFLSPLRSKLTDTRLDVSEVHKRGGEYIESELQRAVNVAPKNRDVVSEIIDKAGDRKAWLIFCAGVDHAEAIANELHLRGITAQCITGDTPKKQREEILERYRAGEIRALTNANVLTTGFDYPDIDLIAMLRPTMSPGLYVQMAGRGLRPKSHTDHCLVLDFAGVVSTHGPITAVRPPNMSSGNGEAPVKPCPQCNEIVHLSAKQCPACGYTFPAREPPKLKLRDDDIMGLRSGTRMSVQEWHWRKHISRASGKEMVAVTYYGKLSDKPITEYFPVTHGGYVGEKAIKTVLEIATKGTPMTDVQAMVASLDGMVENMNRAAPPAAIKYQREGKFEKVVERTW